MMGMGELMFSFWSLFMGIMLFAFIIFLAIYIYAAFALMTIAKKTKTKDPWLAWIPIANLYLMTQIGKVPAWSMLFLLLAVIPFLGAFAVLGVMVWWWWKIAEARKKPGWLALLMLLPLVNLIVIGVIAWTD